MQTHACAVNGSLRLVHALQRGTGHVVVWARDGATARAQARRALLGLEVSAVLHVSALALDPSAGSSQAASRNHGGLDRQLRRLVLRLLECASATGMPALILVEDAGESDAAALERVRRAAECTPRALEWLRMVLVGDERLVRILDDPASSELCSRVCARIYVTRGDAETPSMTTRPVFLDYAALVTLSVGLVALMVLPYLPGARPTPGGDMVAGHPESAPAPQDLSTFTTGSNRVATARFDDGAGVGHAHAFTSPPAPESADNDRDTNTADAPSGPTDVSRTDMWMSDAPLPFAGSARPEPMSKLAARLPLQHAGSLVEARAAMPSVTTDTQAIASAAGPLSTLAAATTADAVLAPAAESAPDAGATSVRPADDVTAVGSRSSLRSHDAFASAASRGAVVEVVRFRDAAAAYAARRRLAPHLGNVVVARVEGQQGPVYSVRVVGMTTSREVAKTERELRRLGYEPKRFEEPNGMSLFSRRLRASLF